MRFSIGILILTHLVMPLIFLTNLAQTRTHSHFDLLLSTLVAVSYVVFVFIVGRWDWFGYWVRFVLLALLCIVVFTVWNNAIEQKWQSGIEVSNWVENVVGLGLSLTFAVLIGKAIRGFQSPANAIDVSFPLCNGRYYVAHGGNDSLINYHHNHTSQRFALDLVKLNRFGVRAFGIYPKSLARYFIFDDPVLSPVEGVVLRSIDGLPDLTPPKRDTDAPAGNHVVIQPACTGVYILLAHLKAGSLRVRKGDHVKLGQIIGRVGNSGNSTEPHLHIHCATIDGDDFVGGGTGVPLLFGGRFLKRNSIVRTGLGQRKGQSATA